MRSCSGRQRAGCWATVGPLYRLVTACAAAARGLHRQAASGWHSAKTMSLRRRHDRHRCWAQPRRQGGGFRRPRAATWAPRPLHRILMPLGVLWAAEMRLALKGVEPRARDRASAGGGPAGVEVERVVCGHRLSSARPRDGAECVPAVVARWTVHGRCSVCAFHVCVLAVSGSWPNPGQGSPPYTHYQHSQSLHAWW